MNMRIFSFQLVKQILSLIFEFLFMNKMPDFVRFEDLLLHTCDEVHRFLLVVQIDCPL